jgi:hypothetical protein
MPIPRLRVLETVLWISNAGTRLQMLSARDPNYMTVRRCSQQRCRRGALRHVLRKLTNTLSAEGETDESESFTDATITTVNGNRDEIRSTRSRMGMRNTAILDRHGLPLSVSTCAANCHEVTLAQLTFDF